MTRSAALQRRVGHVLRVHPRSSAIAVAVLAILTWVRFGPIDPALLDDRATASTIVVDRRGEPLYEALSGDGTRSVLLSAADLPPLLVAATVAAEDRRYWSHPGVDPVAIVRALRNNTTHGRVVEGGSTITQQVAKLLLNRHSPGRRRALRAKVHEAVLALRLEHRFTKREILALYLNLAGYGNQMTGAERASRAYFDRSASMLTHAQAAFLAGLPQRPSGFNPFRGREAALVRQRSVLRRMRSSGVLASADLENALGERLVLARGAASPFAAPHFVEMVLAAAGEGRPGRIETTLDRALQADVQGIIETRRELLRKHGAANVAVVVLDNASGEWLAWEGSGDYFDADHGGTINGPLVPRQPGSALKPFTYAVGFEQGYTPASVLADVPSHFPTAEAGVLYSPRNYDGRYRGPLLVRRALAGSENVPAVALAADLGVPRLLRFLTRAGFSTFDRNASYYGLGLTLGNAEVRLDELVAAYAAMARGGEWIAPSWQRGAAHERRTLVSARTAFWIGDILSDPEAREYIFGRGGSLEFPFPVAVKTGTSQAYHDNWTVGYSRHVTVGVWVGNFDRTPLRDSTGVTGAGPIFHSVMLAAERRAGGTEDSGSGTAALIAPADGDAITRREICALSGRSANSWCPTRQLEWLPADSEMQTCAWHRLGAAGLVTIWPAEFRQWARSSGLVTVPMPEIEVVDASHSPSARIKQNAGAKPSLRVVNPPAGSVYLLDPTLRRDFQTLALRASASASGQIEWRVDGLVVGSARSDASVMWKLSTGTHRVTALDNAGRRAEAEFVVR